jgi:hypothetical protein
VRLPQLLLRHVALGLSKGPACLYCTPVAAKSIEAGGRAQGPWGSAASSFAYAALVNHSIATVLLPPLRSGVSCTLRKSHPHVCAVCCLCAVRPAGERSDVLAGLVLPSPSALSSSAPRTPKSLDAYKTQHADKDKPDYQWCVALSVCACTCVH